MKSELVYGVLRYIKYIMKAVKWVFIVFLFFVGSLFFRVQRLGGGLVEKVISGHVPTNLVVHVDSVSFGFQHGVGLSGLRVYDLTREQRLEPVLQVDEALFHPYEKRLQIVGLRYARLPDGYYAPENLDRNERIEGELPDIGYLRIELVRPDILSVTPDRVTGRVEVTPRKAFVDNIHLVWHDGEPAVGVDGFCAVDLDKQEVRGEVDGLATQAQIRPLLVALDVPVALPYMDAFTEVPENVPAWCGWQVNLVNKDFDLGLRLKPKMGRYNGVAMRQATGKIHLHTETRGNCLNYLTEVGPIEGVDVSDRALAGSVVIGGTNGYNIVTVSTETGMPLSDLLKIGGFTGVYLSDDVIGETKGTLQFRFPRAMTNNYEMLNGEGHVKISNGHLTRFKLFAGLTKLLAERVPGVSAIVDQTAASVDYRIENGVLKTDGIYIEGKLFAVRMEGQFDAVRNDMHFTVRVQFSKDDTLLGKYLINPVTWPFTKLLMEFRLTGSPENPKWEYVSVVDRVLEVLK